MDDVADAEQQQVVRRRNKPRGYQAWRRGIQSDVDPRLVSLFSGWHGPRTVLIPKSEQGYGFTLRHFVVHPPESTQEKNTSDDPTQSQGTKSKRPRPSTQGPLDTIFVKHVYDGGTAHAVGLTPGDRILAVNDIPTSGKSYAEVISIIQNSDGVLKLQVLPEHEDILQMAYKGSSHSLSPNMYPMPYKPSTSINPIQSGATIRVKGQSKLRTATPDDFVHTGHALLRRQWSTSSDDSASEMDERSHMSERGRTLKTSTSYTSGLSIYHDPRGRSGSGPRDKGKDVFRDRMKEFEVRAKENSETPPNKTYSFGLFYPTPSKENGSKSASDLSSVVHRRPRDKVLHPNDSQENISKALNSRSQTTTRVIPLDTRYSREKTPSKENLSSASSGYSTSSSRHSYPDSMSNITPVTVMPRSYTSQTNISTDRAKSELHCTRQYIPVLRSSPATHTTKVTASVDGLDTKPKTPSERNLEIFEHPNQGSGGRTFIVKIGDRHFEGGISQGHSPSQVSMNSSLQKPSYGTAFALTRSPVSGQFELSQEVPIVKHKKMMFEKGQNDNTHVGGNLNRYKTEIQKITSNGKFSSVQERLANFEKEGSPQKLRRMSSSERYSSPEPQCQQQYQRQMSPTNQQQAFPSSTNQTQAFQESAPIRIYVSQGTVSATASPLVEIVPVYQESPQPSVTTKSLMHVQDEGDGTCHSNMHEETTPQRRSYHEGERSEESHGLKPVRKPSFLAAVNAPQQRYSSIHSSQEDLLLGDSPPPVTSSTSWLGSHTSVNSAISHISTGMTPTPSSDSIVALTSTPVKDTAPKVILRRKQENSPEDDAVKLHRRTSYLMATANDRDSHKLSLDKSISSSQSGLEIQEQITPPKSSMTKLKNLFGEKTPAIKEAIERTTHRQDPASPLQEITKQGMLTFKSDLTDGKKASDRSWKNVWVELRGHALYLSKEKKDQSLSHPFSFEDQPISIKSSFVDKAYDYTKKKHVFRLKTFNMSEYLFQAEDEEIMMAWIAAIQSNNNPDADDIGIGQEGLIKRKTSQQESLASQITITALKQSPQVPPKPNKLAVLKSKMPHSPSTKRKKSEKEDGSKKSSLFKFKSFRKSAINSSSGNSDDNCMFGVPLECCIPSPNNDHVPMIVDLCTKIVEARGLEVTGVYRIPGNTAAVNMMQEELNKGIDNMNVEHEKWCDVNVIGSLLKTFFRKLPDPLITAELYQQFINANRIENPQMRMLKLKRLLHELPEHHFETFKHLADHLHTVSMYGHINKMDARNLAIVFGPTLIRKDDDMSALVRDMSDSCRIIESIISHDDWFFSSWDRDNEVPVEEAREDEDAPTNPSVSKMSCDDDDAINPRDIVSSIVQAANLKLRKKSGTEKSYEDLDVSLSEGGFRERNIDLEVKRRGIKPRVEITSRSSPNLMAMSGVVGSQEQLTLVPNRNSDTCSSSDRRMTKSQEIIDTGLKFIDHERVGSNLYAKVRHFSEDSLDRNDELEISHGGMSNSFSVSQSTIDRLRVIEEEARALREKEEKRQREYERRKLERQRIEQEIQRTKKDIELEDSHSVEDLLWQPSSDLLKRSDKGESSSEFSNSSSSISSKAMFGNSPNLAERTRDSGGKYFVIQSVGSRSNSKNSLVKGSSESLTMQSKQTNSMEKLLEVPLKEKVVPRVKSKSRKKEDGRAHGSGREGSEKTQKSRGSLSRNNSMRRGSLDSLIDLKNERQRFSYDSTDSEDGSDLLSDLTSTFDQKLKILVNPKYKLNGSLNRLNSQESNSEKVDTENNNSNNNNGVNAHLNLPPQVPLAHAQVNKYGLCNSNDMLEKQYRDPSLHRSPKDTKIGIAYRFERNPSNSALSQNENFYGSSEVLNSPHSSSSVLTSPSNSSMQNTRPKFSIVNNVQSPYGIPSGSSHNSNWNNSASRSDGRPISKSEKTEVNVCLSKQSRDEKKLKITSADCDTYRETPKGVEFKFSLPKSDSKRGSEKRERELSPQPSNKRKEKRSKRRHTVGGTQDFDHFKALVSLSPTQDSEPARLSAWEQLQPVVKDGAQSAANRSLLSWLQNERLRGSTPDLSMTHDLTTHRF